MDEWVTGVAKAPYDPEYNNTAIMTADGNLYSATVTDFKGRDPAICRIMGPSAHLRSVQYNNKWLHGMLLLKPHVRGHSCTYLSVIILTKWALILHTEVCVIDLYMYQCINDLFL